MNLENFENIYPKIEYTSKHRDLEVKLVFNMREFIGKLNISKEGKENAINLLEKYLIFYQNNYLKIRKAVYDALACMN